MQLKAMTYFNELVRSRSIRQASEKLGVSPMAISRQLENLEQYFDAPLITRSARGIMLTAAGELLASHSQNMMRELGNTRQIIDDLRGLKRGKVAIHVNGAAINGILAPALSQFYTLYPDVSIEVTVSSAQEAHRAVLTGKTDMAITMFSPQDPKIDVRFSIPVQHEVIMSTAHPLSVFKEISLEDIRQYPLAMPDSHFDIRLNFDHHQREAGLDPIEATFTTSSLELQKELALHGTALLILPAISVVREIESGQLTVRPFEANAKITADLQLGRSKSAVPSFAADKLTDFLEGFLSEKIL